MYGLKKTINEMHAKVLGTNAWQFCEHNNMLGFWIEQIVPHRLDVGMVLGIIGAEVGRLHHAIFGTEVGRTSKFSQQAMILSSFLRFNFQWSLSPIAVDDNPFMSS